MTRRYYDGMSGLDMYDDDMEGFMSPRMLQEQVIAAGAGAGAILIGAWLLPKLPAPASWSEPNQHRMRAGLGVVASILAAKYLWDWNRDAAIAVLGGVGGLGVAQLVDSFFDANLLGGGYPLGMLPNDSALSGGDMALLSSYDQGSALSAMEAVGVSAAAPAFPVRRSPLGDPTVTPEQLFGLGGTVAQTENLGYGPWLA